MRMPNPGHKRCRICKALITDEFLTRRGSSNYHEKCVYVDPRKTTTGIKKINPKFRQSRQNWEDT